MNEEQERIAEEIIRLHFYREHHNFNWLHMERYLLKLPKDFVTQQSFKSQLPIIKKYLIDNGYIEKVALSFEDMYHLTDEKGVPFESFEAERKKERAAKQVKAIEDFPKKKWHIYEPVKYLLTLTIRIIIGTVTLRKCNTGTPLKSQPIHTVQSPDTTNKNP